MKSTVILTTLLLLCVLPHEVFAGGCKERLFFTQGVSMLETRGSIQGYDYCDYVFHARKGQSLRLLHAAERADTVLVAPEERQLFNNQALKLRETGDYVIRVLFPRALAPKKKQRIVHPASGTDSAAAAGTLPENPMNPVAPHARQGGLRPAVR